MTSQNVLSKLNDLHASSTGNSADVDIHMLAGALSIPVSQLIPLLIELETEDLVTLNIVTEETGTLNTIAQSGTVRVNRLPVS